jgi:hypothetical protein
VIFEEIKMKKTIALLLICLISGLSNYAIAAEKIMTVHQRAAGVEATTDNIISGFQDFAPPVGTGVAVTDTKITLGGARNTDGAVWYGGDSDAGYCVNGICNFGIGIRAYFEFRFLTVDNNANSQTYGNGFTFNIINGSNNVKTDRGGSPTGSGLEALMGYAGPGNTASLGLEPPKMAIEFDTWPNRGLATNTPCTNNNRYDANNVNNYNHLALMLWGANATGSNCTGGYPRVSYDDNVHSAGSGTGDTSYPSNSARGDGTGGYYEVAKVAGSPNWLEDNVVHRFRIEVIRESISTDTTMNYIVKAWVDCAGCTAAQLAAFQDTSLPYPPTPTGLSPQINRTIVLSSALHTAFNTMLFGFTQATSSTTSQAQNIEITNFAIYFPPCASDEPPGGGWTYCAEENGTCSFSGTRLVAYGRNCFYNYLNATGSIGCNNGIFGDPHVGVYKKCYYK